MKLENNCPVTSLPILQREVWKNIEISDNYYVDFSKIGDSIFLSTPRGNAKDFNPYKYYAIRDKIIEEEFGDKKIIILRDYSKIIGKPSKRVRGIQKVNFLNEQDTKLAIIVFSVSSFLKLIFKIGFITTKVKDFLVIKKNYEEAILFAEKILQEKEKINLSSFDINNLALYKSWKYSKNNFKSDIYKLEDNLLLVRTSGYLKLEYLDEAYSLLEKAFRETYINRNREFIKIIDYTESMGGSFSSRLKYLKYTNTLYSGIEKNKLKTYICGATSLVKIQIKFVSKWVNTDLIFVDSIDDALNRISNNQLYKNNKLDTGNNRNIEVKKRDLDLLTEHIGSFIWGDSTEEDIDFLKIPESLKEVYEAILVIKSDYIEMTKKVDSQKKNLEDAIIEANNANQLKSTFLANISHEIRTPLTGILGMTEILKDTNLSEPQKSFLDIISKSSQDLLTIVTDILDFSKIEAKKMEIENISFLLKDTVFEVFNFFNLSVRKPNLDFLIEFDDDLDFMVYSDPIKLKQVIKNLINNAIKFTSKGYIKLVVKPKKIVDDSVIICFEVIDSGIGINENEIDNLFSPFIQADTSTSRKYGGTGLGLSISKKITELLGGRIGAKINPSGGSIFYFTANFKIDQDNIFHDKKENINLIEQNKLKSLNILLAEDNEINQIIIESLLEKKGVSVITVNNGEEAIEIYKKEKFDLIFMDCHMPIIDGFEATHNIRDYEKEKGLSPTLIIALTADVFKKTKDKCEMSMDGYLTKPIVVEELYEWVNICFEKVVS